MGKKLDSGTTFPALELKLTQGGTVRLPDDIASDYAVVLFYRGHW